MDNVKMGRLLARLRKEKGLTQKRMADAMHISDRTISKWERGAGFPDIALLRELSDFLGVEMNTMLSGDLGENQYDGGNMKKIKFYVCQDCGNVSVSSSGAQISCCGRRLMSLDAQPCDTEHATNIENVECEQFVTVKHDMQKGHYISFVAHVGYDSVHIVKLYPEQDAQLRMPFMRGGTLYVYCTRDGLFAQPITGA